MLRCLTCGGLDNEEKMCDRKDRIVRRQPKEWYGSEKSDGIREAKSEAAK